MIGRTHTKSPRRSALLAAASATAVLLSIVSPAGVSQVSASAGDAPITGSFFVDFDFDGTIDAGEVLADTDVLFPPGTMSVSASDSNGTTVPCSILTGAAPGYSCDVSLLDEGPFRIAHALDAGDVSTGWSESFAGPDSPSSVQFANAGAALSFGVTPPSACPTSGSNEGILFTTCVVYGDRTDPTGPDTVVVALDYDQSAGPSAIGDKSNLGSVWGVAYDEWTSTLFVSAHLQRGMDLGVEGLDGLYWQTYPGGSGSWTELDLESLGGPGFGTDPVQTLTAATNPQHDPNPFPLVGKTGIGDIDISADGRLLSVVNIEAKAVMVYDITAVRSGGNPTLARSIPLSNPGCPDTANADDWYPWALTAVDADTVYVGITCTAENSTTGAADLESNIVSVDIVAGTQGATVIPGISLGYDRGPAANFIGGSGEYVDGDWNPWIDGATFAEVLDGPQPILSDIEIGPDGSMVLGYTDRSGLQHGGSNYQTDVTDTAFYTMFSAGEILRVCNTTGDPDNVNFQLEGAAGSGCDAFANFTSPTADDTLSTFHGGPAGTAEYYGNDRWDPNAPRGHSEQASGGLYIHPLLDEVVVASIDPNAFSSGGLEYFNNTDGSVENDLLLYSGGNAAGYAGKGSGIGDVEGCWIPLEIGNFVWLDLDQDGIQDPNEPVMEGVKVDLALADGTPVASTTTDANGNYTFDSYDGLLPNTDYVLTFDESMVALPMGLTPTDLTLTTADAGSDDAIDSDAAISGVSGLAEIAVTTGDNGTADHTFDVGYAPPLFMDLAMAKTLDIGAIDNAAGTATFLIEITNQGTIDAEAIEVTDYIDLTMWEPFDAALNPAGTTAEVDIDADGVADGGSELSYVWASPGIVTLTGTLPVRESVVVPITVAWRVPVTSPSALTNWAEISNFDDDTDAGNGDAASGAVLDIDSTPDATRANDNAPTGPGAPGDDVIDEDAKNAGGDEDDHDVAGLSVHDLALIKVVDTANSELPVSHGAEITFTIQVVNQGTLHATNISVYDYVDTAMWEPFSAALNPATADYAWAAAGSNGQATLAAPLAPGATMSISVTLVVSATADLTNLVNAAEISGSTASDAAGTPVTYSDGSPIPDVDSVPDTTNSDPQPANPGDPTDNVTNNAAGPGGIADEDDHDIAGIDAPAFSIGNQVWFDVNNNGIVDADETPLPNVWMELFSDNDGNGLPDDISGDGIINTSDAVATTGTDALGHYLFANLEPGEYIVGIPPMEWDVDAPLYGYLSSDPTQTDPDDDVDLDDNGTPGAYGYVWSGPVTLGDGEPTAESPDNDATTIDSNENLTVDFGFHLPIFDLALRKQLKAGVTEVRPGDTVTFVIEIFNQGNVAAADPSIIDYIPAGLTLADSDWTAQADGTATIALTGTTIQPGSSTEVEIDLKVNSGAKGSLINTAEITNALPVDVNGQVIRMPNGQPIPDIDSVPDATNNDAKIDDQINSNAAAGDEDDNDIAVLSITQAQTNTTPLAQTGSSSASTFKVATLLILVGATLMLGVRASVSRL